MENIVYINLVLVVAENPFKFRLNIAAADAEGSIAKGTSVALSFRITNTCLFSVANVSNPLWICELTSPYTYRVIAIVLHAELPPEYPDVVPLLRLEQKQGLNSSHVDSIQQLINQEVK